MMRQTLYLRRWFWVGNISLGKTMAPSHNNWQYCTFGTIHFYHWWRYLICRHALCISKSIKKMLKAHWQNWLWKWNRSDLTTNPKLNTVSVAPPHSLSMKTAWCNPPCSWKNRLLLHRFDFPNRDIFAKFGRLLLLSSPRSGSTSIGSRHKYWRSQHSAGSNNCWFTHSRTGSPQCLSKSQAWNWAHLPHQWNKMHYYQSSGLNSFQRNPQGQSRRKGVGCACGVGCEGKR